MRCDDCQPRLEEYFDGELNQQLARQVQDHLTDCVLCSQILHGLNTEHEIYGSYAPDIQVTPQMWSNVRARLAVTNTATRATMLDYLFAAFTNRFTRPRISVWTTAGLVVAAIGLTILVMRYATPTQQQDPHPVTAALPHPTAEKATDQRVVPERETTKAAAGPTRAPRFPRNTGSLYAQKSRTRPTDSPSLRTKTPSQLVQEAEQKYLMAIALLSLPAQRQRSRLDAVAQAKIEQALVSIDRTIAGTRMVVRKHPNDPVAVQYMLTAYARKVDMLREMVDH